MLFCGWFSHLEPWTFSENLMYVRLHLSAFSRRHSSHSPPIITLRFQSLTSGKRSDFNFYPDKCLSLNGQACLPWNVFSMHYLLDNFSIRPLTLAAAPFMARRSFGTSVAFRDAFVTDCTRNKQNDFLRCSRLIREWKRFRVHVAQSFLLRHWLWS